MTLRLLPLAYKDVLGELADAWGYQNAVMLYDVLGSITRRCIASQTGETK